MKKLKLISLLTLVFTLTFFFTSASSEEGEGANWYTDFDEAVAAASAEDKSILMSFSGSDWCVNCMRLERTLFESGEFMTYAKENLILLKLDFPAKKKNKLPEVQQKHNDELAEKYNKGGKFPTVVFLNKDENTLGELAHPLESAAAYMENIKGIIGG
ncbi:MAG: thioredoxin-related protein [Crocinitomix sp.]|jgi:thioredoxin-related protein